MFELVEGVDRGWGGLKGIRHGLGGGVGGVVWGWGGGWVRVEEGDGRWRGRAV
jgi:hypothetical protein